EMEKEAILQSLVEHVVYHDKEMKILWANRAACESVGMSLEDIVGRFCYEIWAQRRSPCEDCPVRKARDEGKPQGIEKTTPDGRTWYIQGHLVRDSHGDLLGTVELALDITERKRAEKAISETEKKYRSLFEESNDAIYLTSREGKFLDANRALLELMGYTREEIINSLNARDIYVDPNDRNKFQREIERKGSVRNYEVKFHKKNGEEMDCLLTATVRKSENGTILGYQGITRDITEYKRAVKALKQSEARYRAIVEDQTELICRFFPDGKIFFVNEAYCRYFEKTRVELMGQTFMPFIPDEDHDKVKSKITSLSPENPVSTHEHRVIAPNGEIRWQQWTNRMLFVENGQQVEFQAVGRDITERKRMEEELKKNAEKIQQFAYSISHDLKGPAIGIHGLTKLLHRHYGPDLDEKGRNYCEQILKAGEQISEFVDQINLYMSTKEFPLSIEKVSLKDLLKSVRVEFYPQLHLRQIRWKEPKSMPEINCDSLSILRVFRNLIDNALKYGGDELNEIKIGYEDADEFHTLSVSNNGMRIRTEISEKIFDVFQRHETSRGIQGTGLGLAIVKEIARQHWGKAWVESGPERGTTFFMSISKKL
ncbi:MAG: PAS domain S-box protein, partial [Deltaproteobacteria bacterium]|nr:PAS domain S-box protein [Deltaproteobacteria bacterium]